MEEASHKLINDIHNIIKNYAAKKPVNKKAKKLISKSGEERRKYMIKSLKGRGYGNNTTPEDIEKAKKIILGGKGTTTPKLTGRGIDSEDVAHTANKALDYINEGVAHLPVIGEVSDVVNTFAEPIINKLFGTKSNLLESAKLAEEGVDIHHDQDLLYNEDGSLMFPIEKQKAYKFVDR